MTTEERQQLTPHFKLYEFTRSGTAMDHDLPNNPGPQKVEALRALCKHILEPLREHFGPILISSGYRSTRLNDLVRGARGSQHIRGEAADIVIGSPRRGRELYHYIIAHLDFDQLVWEPMGADTPRWLHVSYTRRRKCRHAVL